MKGGKEMSEFSWKTWLIKGGKKILLVASVAVLNEGALMAGASELPTEYLVWGAVIASVLSQVANIVKHTYLAE